MLYLPALDRSAGLQATPEEPLPPSSAEPPRRPAAASRPVYQTGTAPGPSAGCALPLQGTSGKEPSVKLDEWPLRFYKTAPRRRTKRFSIVLILLARVKPHFPSSFQSIQWFLATKSNTKNDSNIYIKLSTYFWLRASECVCTSHFVHSDDELTQSVHQRSVLHRASFLQTQLLPLRFATVLWWSPAGRVWKSLITRATL